jgi:hypothetical protein
MCTVCTTRGCLSSNGVVQAFSESPAYTTFPATQTLTATWAATDSVLCFAGGHLQCANLQLSTQPPGSTGTEERPHTPTIVAPTPLGAPIPPAPRCIACGIDPAFIDTEKQGRYTVKLVVMIGKNGTVTSVETQGAPTPEIDARIQQQAEQWVFEPYVKDGIAANVKLNTSVSVYVVKAR